MEIRQDGPLLLIEQERFDARFPADPADDLEQLQHQDFYVTVKGGPTYYASLMTLGAIDVVLRRWAETGEAASGRYFFTTDLVITPRPGITAMIEANLVTGGLDAGPGPSAMAMVPGRRQALIAHADTNS